LNLTTKIWRKCSACKKDILVKSKYFICSVSTCNGQRTGYVFCSVACFERHLPGARHKDAAAIEKIADSEPGAESASPSQSDGDSPKFSQRIIIKGSPGSPVATAQRQLPREVLVIASRFKEYITAKAEMNTSGSVMEVVSDYLRVLADRAIDNARAEGRKTVLERDFDFLKK
jgi:histone H3/H4